MTSDVAWSSVGIISSPPTLDKRSGSEGCILFTWRSRFDFCVKVWLQWGHTRLFSFLDNVGHPVLMWRVMLLLYFDIKLQPGSGQTYSFDSSLKRGFRIESLLLGGAWPAFLSCRSRLLLLENDLSHCKSRHFQRLASAMIQFPNSLQLSWRFCATIFTTMFVYIPKRYYYTKFRALFSRAMQWPRNTKHNTNQNQNKSQQCNVFTITLQTVTRVSLWVKKMSIKS